MYEVYLVKSENKIKAEDLLKRDDLVSRGSIMIKSPSSLDINETGFFFILDAGEGTLKRAEELLKDVGIKYKDKQKVVDKYLEQEDQAIQAFGNIMG